MTDPATIYEEWFVPALFAPLAREVIARTEIPANARVLDVACGTGVVARLMAPHVGSEGRVVGLDLNPGMLAHARRAAAAEGLEIEWLEGSALELPFEDGAFDLVVCQMGLQFFPDKARAVAEMRRVLAFGGHVAIVVARGLDQHPFFAALACSVRARLGAPAIELPFSLGDPAVVAGMLQDAGFADVLAEPIEIVADYTRPKDFVALQIRASAVAIPPLKDLSPAEMDALIAAVESDMTAQIQEATEGGRLRFPMHGMVARGRQNSPPV